MVTGRVSTRARRACVSLSIAGSMLVMGAVVLAIVTLAPGVPHSLTDASVIAWLLLAGGLVCGAIMITVSVPAPGQARPARRGRRGAHHSAPAQPQPARAVPERARAVPEPARAVPDQPGEPQPAPDEHAPDQPQPPQPQPQPAQPKPVPPLPQRIPGRNRPPRLFGQPGRRAHGAAGQVAPAQQPVPASPVRRGTTAPPSNPVEPADPAPSAAPAQPIAPAQPVGAGQTPQTARPEEPSVPGKPDPAAGLAGDPGPTEDWIKELRQGQPQRKPRPD